MIYLLTIVSLKNLQVHVEDDCKMQIVKEVSKENKNKLILAGTPTVL